MTKKQKQALMEQATHPALTETERQTQWQGCCKLALNLHQRPDELARFQVKLQNGYRIPYVDDQQLVPTALALVSGMATAGVRRWNWLPPPSADDLADPAAWVARRLAERRFEQNDAERDRLLRQREARAFGQAQPAGNGTLNPVHEQRSKYGLDELGDRLEQVMAKHRAERGEFRREWLDHRSKPFYIPVRNGGISNKQVTIMAGEITGRRERRTFEESWKIVTDWLHQGRTQRSTQA
jgi:hypothetical protein